MNFTEILWLYFVVTLVLTLTIFSVKSNSLVQGIKNFFNELI
jgi:hypothetical protein